MRLLADLGRRLGRTGLVAVDELLPELLLASAPRFASELRQRVLGPLETGRPQRTADLVKTLSVYLDSGLDRRSAATRLHVHPNTLDYRLRQVHELSALDVHRPEDLVLVALALRERELSDAT
jgi:DNA-binding PucR family transcriptional regulator